MRARAYYYYYYLLLCKAANSPKHYPVIYHNPSSARGLSGTIEHLLFIYPVCTVYVVCVIVRNKVEINTDCGVRACGGGDGECVHTYDVLHVIDVPP